jgi:hypothetical protein
MLDDAMAKMPGTVKFCIHVLHLESEVVFSSQKGKPDMPIGDEQESHRLNQVTFTCPRVETRSSRTRITGCSLTNIQEECFSNPQVMDATLLVQEKPPTSIDISTTHYITDILGKN